MKIRKGFISNSSISSFVVAFPKEPKTAKEVQEMVFKGMPVLLDPYWDPNDQHLKNRKPSYSAEKVSETIFEYIKNQKPNNRKAIYDSIRNGYFYGRRDFDEFRTKGSSPNDKFAENIDWEAYDKKNNSIARKIANAFLSINSDRFIYVFEFSDNDGQYFCALEHGDVFKNLHHIVTSYH